MLPHELTRMDMRQLVKFLQSHRGCLLPFFKAEGIDSTSQKFSQFLQAIQKYPQFKDAVVGKAESSKSVQECWVSKQIWFPLLQELCGGFAAAFPKTATVESDFSIIDWEKDECIMDLTELSLEGILHSKQY